MGLGEFDTPELNENEACAALNEDAGLDPATDCMVYQYVVGGIGCELRPCDWDDDGYVAVQCEGAVAANTPLDCDDTRDNRSPGLTETCDGIDNDCDAVIDEDALVFNVTPQVSVQNTGAVSHLVATHGRDGQIGVLYDAGGGGHINLIGPDHELQGPTLLSYTYSVDQDTPTIPAVNDGYCIQDDSTGVAARTTCSFSQFFGDRADEGAWIAATINTTGCSLGQVRVGHIVDSGKQFILRGPEQHSNIYEGVDVVLEAGDNQCTGASRSGDGATLGATGLSGAALKPWNQSFSQALVAWLADDMTRDQCGGEVVNIEILGVWLESISNNETSWVNGTNDGIPQPLSESLGPAKLSRAQTVGGAAPAIVPTMRQEEQMSDEGYYIGHGNADGGISLYFLPAFAPPPPYQYTTPVATTEVRTTDALNLQSSNLAMATLNQGVTNADYVHMALGQYDIQNDEQTIGLVWQEGCGDSNVRIKFSKVTYAEGVPGEFTFSTPVQLNAAAGSQVVMPPRSVYMDAGLVSNEFTRNDLSAAETGTGGWFVIWGEQQDGTYDLKGRRILAMDGQAVLEAPEELRRQASPIQFVEIYPTTESSEDYYLGVSYWSQAEQQIQTIGSMCTP